MIRTIVINYTENIGDLYPALVIVEAAAVSIGRNIDQAQLTLRFDCLLQHCLSVSRDISIHDVLELRENLLLVIRTVDDV